jgi:hypothetical protein
VKARSKLSKRTAALGDVNTEEACVGAGRMAPTPTRSVKGTRNLNEAAIQTQQRTAGRLLRRVNADAAAKAPKIVDCQR